MSDIEHIIKLDKVLYLKRCSTKQDFVRFGDIESCLYDIALRQNEIMSILEKLVKDHGGAYDLALRHPGK
jgi:hypothetical protein